MKGKSEVTGDKFATVALCNP